MPQKNSWLGTVVAVQANFYRVKLDTPTSSDLDSIGEISHHFSDDLLCTRRAILKKTGQSVVVGDRVKVEDPDWAGGRGAIHAVLPRTTELGRPPVANADQILLLFSIEQPTLDPMQLTKFLLTAEQTQMKVLLGLSKADLVDEDTQTYWCDRLKGWGYDAIPISLETLQGIDQLTAQLDQKLTVLSGPSGVGKSSLINHLIPDLDVRVGAVSERWHQGRHTTRHVELFPLAKQGLLADSPGFNQPNLEMNPSALAPLFPEIRGMLSQGSCQFNDCLHQNEPNCAIHEEWDRRDFYLQLLEEMVEKHELSQQRHKQEKQKKVKSGSSGKKKYEPRLEQKKYRRQSRRSQHQKLEDFFSEEYSEEMQ